MIRKFLSFLLCLFSLSALAQKPDFIRTPNGPNTIVDWNLKAKTLIIPHGGTLSLAGAQDSTGHVRVIVTSGDTSLYFYVKGKGWINSSKITSPNLYILKADSSHYVTPWYVNNYFLNKNDSTRFVKYKDSTIIFTTPYQISHTISDYYGNKIFHGDLNVTGSVTAPTINGNLVTGGSHPLTLLGSDVSSSYGNSISFASGYLNYRSTQHSFFDLFGNLYLTLGNGSDGPSSYAPHFEVTKKPALPHDVENKRSVDSLIALLPGGGIGGAYSKAQTDSIAALKASLTQLNLKQPRIISALPIQTTTRPLVGDSVNAVFAKLILRGDSTSSVIPKDSSLLSYDSFKTSHSTLTTINPGSITISQVSGGMQLSGSPGNLLNFLYNRNVQSSSHDFIIYSHIKYTSGSGGFIGTYNFDNPSHEGIIARLLVSGGSAKVVIDKMPATIGLYTSTGSFPIVSGDSLVLGVRRIGRFVMAFAYNPITFKSATVYATFPINYPAGTYTLINRAASPVIGLYDGTMIFKDLIFQTPKKPFNWGIWGDSIWEGVFAGSPNNTAFNIADHATGNQGVNMSIGGNTFFNINKSIAIDLGATKTNFAFLADGINDANGSKDSTTFARYIDTAIVRFLSVQTIPVLITVTPWHTGNTTAKTFITRYNSNINSRVNDIPVINTFTPLNDGTGYLQTQYDAGDGHLNQLGNGVMATSFLNDTHLPFPVNSPQVLDYSFAKGSQTAGYIKGANQIDSTNNVSVLSDFDGSKGAYISVTGQAFGNGSNVTLKGSVDMASSSTSTNTSLEGGISASVIKNGSLKTALFIDQNANTLIGAIVHNSLFNPGLQLLVRNHLSTQDIFKLQDASSNDRVRVENSGTVSAYKDGINSSLGTSANIVARGLTDTTKRVNIGMNTTSNFGWLESVHSGSAWYPLVLFPTANSGNVGVSITAPSARLHLPAGTATASTAPLKLTSGTNMTAAEAGAIEFDGTDLTYTTSTPTRRTVVNLIAAQTINNKTFSTANIYRTPTGAVTDSVTTKNAATGQLGAVPISNFVTTSTGRIGTATLTDGTVAISITGITSSSKAFVTRTVASNASLSVGLTAVCTSGTLTITADVAAGTINIADTSTFNYQVIN